MPIEGANLENLLERVIQMNMIVIEEMHQQRKQITEQQVLISSQLSTHSSTTVPDEALTDPLSRSFNKINVKPKEYNGTNEENVVTWLIALEEIMANQLTHDDDRISLILSLLGGTALQWFVNLKLKNQRRSSWNEFKGLVKKELHLFTYDESHELLHRKLNDKQTAPYIPFISRLDLVLKMHNAYGHIRVDDIQELLQTKAWWPGMKADVQQWIKTYVNCQISTCGKTTTEPLHPLTPVPPFHRWSFDFIGQLPVTSNGNQWILIALDHTTKWSIVRVVPNATHEVVAKFVYQEIVLNFGCPTEIITDRGNNFTIAMLNSYFKLIGIKHILTSAYHPRSNSIIERFNRLFGSMLAKYVADNAINQWDEYVDRALFACRTRQHHATGKTPFYMVYGVEAKLPGDELIPIINDDEQSNITNRVQQITQLLQQRDTVHERSDSNANKMKQYYNLHSRNQAAELHENDWVLIHNENRKKFHSHWIRPYKIRKICPLGTYQLENVKGQIKLDLVHRDMLKRAYVNPRTMQQWYKPSRRNNKHHLS
ncbi:unnamed protein product [Rotaria sp. Silwood1]|nr:unnamed protein product [Rotaria sp. Silwood1]